MLKIHQYSLLVCSLISIQQLAYGQSDSKNRDSSDIGTITVDENQLPQNYPSVKSSPVRTNLNVSMPQSTITEDFIQNVIPPTGTINSTINVAPSAYSYNANGLAGSGTGNESIRFRGFGDGNFTQAFDGIPYGDSNDYSHHGYGFFIAPMLGGVVMDRSPGTASSIGGNNYGGTINFLSRNVTDEKFTSVIGLYGSGNTFMEGVEYSSGPLGESGNTKFLFGAYNFSSDGWLSYDEQQKLAGFFKLQSKLTSDLDLTLYLSGLRFNSNPGYGSQYAVYALPNTSYSNLFRSSNYYNSNIAGNQNNYSYDTYDVPTYFNYVGLKYNFGDGFKADNKTYYYGYDNQDYYLGGYTTPPASGADATLANIATSSNSTANWPFYKINAYKTVGNILKFTKDYDFGTLGFGLWTEYGITNRYGAYFPAGSPTPSVGSPSVTLPTLTAYNQTYNQTVIQPYVEFTFKPSPNWQFTPGYKYNIYQLQTTQYPDCGPTPPPGSTQTSTCSGLGSVGNLGGMSSLTENATYYDFLPFFDFRYFIQKNWNFYGQYAEGDVKPATNLMDVTGSYQVTALAAPIKTHTTQFGSVYQSPKLMFNIDIYTTKLDQTYSPSYDSNFNTYYSSSGSSSTYQGIETEANYSLTRNLNLYVNASVYGARLDSSQAIPVNIPSDMETVGLFYRDSAWNSSIFVKRLGPQWNSKGSTVDFYQVPQIFLTSLAASYTFRDLGSFVKSVQLKFGIDNLFDQVQITSAKFAGSTPVPGASLGDTITQTAGRQIYVGLTSKF